MVRGCDVQNMVGEPMSTIHKAFQKRSGGNVDFGVELSALDGVGLFPPPVGQQAKEFAQLANMLLDYKSASRGTVLVFASSVSGEGASYVSYNTARQLAHLLDRHVAWIDANYKSPQRKLLAMSDLTFSDLLRSPDRFQVPPHGARMRLIPGGLDLEGCAGLLASDTYSELLRNFMESFDFTIIDAPPILETVEASLLAGPADGMIVVVERKRLKWEVIRSGLDMLVSRRVNVLGTVFNRRTYDLPRVIYDRL